MESFRPSTPYQYLLTAYLLQFLFPQYIMSTLQQKITRYTKRQKLQFEETEQDMARILESTDQEFFKTMINNILRAF